MKYIDSEQRPWGKFYVIHDEPNYKLKRIEVEPGFRLVTSTISIDLKPGQLFMAVDL